MPSIACPNRPCPARFDPTAVEPDSVVTCPACGTRFRIGRANASPSNAGKTIPPRLSFLPVFILVAVVAVGTVVILCATARRQGPGPNAEKEIRYADHNFALRPPSEPWGRDRDAEAALAMNGGVYTRIGPDAGVAYAAQTFGDRDARPSELKSFLDDRFRRLCETPQRDSAEDLTWFDRPAIRVTFRGTRKGQSVVAGEAWAVAIKGFAYYFVAWAPEREAPGLAATFTDARARVRLLSSRDAWRDTRPPGTVFHSATHPYTLTDSDGLWAVPNGSRPTDEDPLADLWIQCTIKPRGRAGDAAARADAFAYVLPASPDPQKAAESYVTTRPSRNPESHTEFVVSAVTEPVEGDEPLGGSPAGPKPTVRLKLTHPRNPDFARLIVVSAAEIGGRVVAVEATCLWKDREVFERRLVSLAASLTLKQ
jgi:hypothetical protein